MRRGVVLVVVLLLMVAVTLLAVGSLRVALSFRAGAAESWEAVRARRAAEADVRAAVGRGDTLPSPWTSPDPGLETAREVLRPSSELLLVVGRSRAGPARWWVGQLVWRGEPRARGLDVGWAARVGATLVADPTAGVDVQTGWACGLGGAPGRVGPLAAGGPRLGPMPLDTLALRLPSWDPVGRGPCPAEGCPIEAGVADGDLEVSGGLYRGLFVVRGDLRLAGDTEIRGTVLIGGSLVMAGSARITGTVEVAGSALLSGDARVVGDPCAVAESWAEGLAEALGPVPVDARPWPLWGLPP